MFLGMGPLELGLILVVVLIIFGPKNLPKLGQALGKTAKNFREGMDEVDAAKDALKAEKKDPDVVDVQTTEKSDIDSKTE